MSDVEPAAAGAAEFEVPEVVSNGSPARRLRDAVEPLAMHAVWGRVAVQRLSSMGVDVLAGYVGGRAAFLGQPSTGAVAAAFAWFDPAVIASWWETAKAAAAQDDLVAARHSSVVDSLRVVLGDDDPGEVADVLSDALFDLDGKGRALFSGLRAQGRPEDPHLRLWWVANLIREHRGDSHIVAANAAGLDAVLMNVLTELWLGMPIGTYTASRGWSSDVIKSTVDGLERRGWLAADALTEEGRRVRRAIEAATDAQEQDLVDALGPRLDEVCEQLNRWSERCMAHNAFAVDSLKRAAG